MFIQTETTPNPATLKFLPGRIVLEEGVREFAEPEDAVVSPLAKALFNITGVRRVFFAHDFLTVTKHEAVEWDHVKAPILAAIMDQFTSDAPILEEEGEGDEGHSAHVYEGDTAAVVEEIKDLLDSRIRPAVAQDGGDILFSKFEPETGTVWLHMRGACSGCPSSAATLKAGVENMLRHYVPEVTRVEQVL